MKNLVALAVLLSISQRGTAEWAHRIDKSEKHCAQCYITSSGELKLGETDSTIGAILENGGVNSLLASTVEDVGHVPTSVFVCRLVCRVVKAELASLLEKEEDEGITDEEENARFSELGHALLDYNGDRDEPNAGHEAEYMDDGEETERNEVTDFNDSYGGRNRRHRRHPKH